MNTLFGTTPHVIFMDCDLVAIIYCNLFRAYLSPLVYRRIHTTLSCCIVPFCNAIFTTNWFATWGLKLDSKDVQGRVGMNIKANILQSLPMETLNISFSNMWNILLNTFCCLHVYVIYFHSFVCFVSRSMVLKIIES